MAKKVFGFKIENSNTLQIKLLQEQKNKEERHHDNVKCRIAKKKCDNNQYWKGSSYSKRDTCDWNNNNFYGGGKKNDNKIISKPMFYNSELENNGNPEWNITTFM